MELSLTENHYSCCRGGSCRRLAVLKTRRGEESTLPREAIRHSARSARASPTARDSQTCSPICTQDLHTPILMRRQILRNRLLCRRHQGASAQQQDGCPAKATAETTLAMELVHKVPSGIQ